MSLFFLLLLSCGVRKPYKSSQPVTLTLEEYGGRSEKDFDNSPALRRLLQTSHRMAQEGKSVKISLKNGSYHFYPDSLPGYELFISNHDHVKDRKVAFMFEGITGGKVVVEGGGQTKLLFHGRQIPFVVKGCSGVVLQGFSIDDPRPALMQIEVLEMRDEDKSMLVRVPEETRFEVRENKIVLQGEDFEVTPFVAMPFEEDRRMVWGRADVAFNPAQIIRQSERNLILKGWNEYPYASQHNRYVLRSYYRPAPGIVVMDSKNIELKDVVVHYAEGMGLIAQDTENISLDGFKVEVAQGSERYFTLQADATHFSGCRGYISSVNGLYEQMADDAINVHGTYLRVDSVLNASEVQASFAHGQSFGLRWYESGDSIRFIDRKTLLPVHTSKIQSFFPLSEGDQKRRMIAFEDPLPLDKIEGKQLAVENLSAYPTVLFSKNIVRNNRARGALFSTIKKVVCEENLFDHTHGSAILLCGDSNGWYESGPCEEVIISKNRFVNPLTGMYQFTNGIISVDPVIRELDSKDRYYHGRIVVEDNIFETFDSPLYYAKSVREFVFRRNKVIPNNDYRPLFEDTRSRRIHVGNVIEE